MYLSFNRSNKFKSYAKESLPKTRDIYSAVSVMIKKNNYQNETYSRNGCSKALDVLE